MTTRLSLPGESALALRSELWDGGFRPVAVYNINADVPSPGKAPIGRDWVGRARRDPPEAVSTYSTAALNTGVLCDGLRAIDIDIEDANAVGRIRALAFAQLGETIFRYRENSSRCLLLYRAAEGEPPKRVLTGEQGKVEVLGHGQQFVGFGHHPSGAKLRWTSEAPNEIPRDSLPAVSEDQISSFLAACAPIIGADDEVVKRNTSAERTPGEPQADPARIAEAMALIPNDGPADWEAWNRVGMAVWRATGGSTEGWAIFDEWSSRNPAAYDPKVTRARWNGYATSPPTQIGAGTIFYLAQCSKAAGQTKPVPKKHLAGQIDLVRRGVKTNLPAYFPPPTQDRAAALLRQAAIIADTIAEGTRLAAARAEAWTRRNFEISLLGLHGLDLSPGKKGAITRRQLRAVAIERGYGSRLPVRGPRMLLTGTQGSGKTRDAITAVAAITEPVNVWLTEPTLDKAAEVAADYARATHDNPEALPGVVVRGRAAADPRRLDHQMCDRAQVAGRVAAAGLSVRKMLCETCPFRAECGYRKQADRIDAMPPGAVFFLAIPYLFLPSPPPAPDVLIVDEKATIDAIELAEIEVTALDPFMIPGLAIHARDRLNTLRLTLLEREPALRALRAAHFDRAELTDIVRSLEVTLKAATPVIDGRMTDSAIGEALDASPHGNIRSTLKVVSAVLSEIDMPRAGLNGVAATSDRKAITVSRMRTPRGIKRATILALDGSGDPDLNRALFGDTMQHARIAVERTAAITGTIGRGYSRQSITGIDASGAPIEGEAQARSAKLRADIGDIAHAMPGTTAIFSNLATIDALVADQTMATDAPAGHFNRLRGLNCWEGYRSALVIGQTSLTIDVLESLARAYMATDFAPFISMAGPLADAGWECQQWPFVVTRMRRMRDGSRSPVQVHVHPDPRVQRVLEQMREAEIVQAADRVRPIFNRRDITLLNNLCVDVTYDAIRTHRELRTGGNPIQAAFTLTGFIARNSADLFLAHPDRFCSERAAQRALQNYPPNANKEPLCVGGVVSYRTPSQRGPASTAIVDLTFWPDPLAALQHFLGEIIEFEGVAVEQPEPAPRVARIGGQHPIRHADMIAGLLAGSRLRPPAQPERAVPDG